MSCDNHPEHGNKEIENLIDNLGIEITSVGGGTVTGKIPVDKRTVQPFGYLHGGATCSLLETLASIGAFEYISEEEIAFGTRLDVSYLHSVRQGWVRGKATHLSSEGSEQIWGLSAVREDGEIVAEGKCYIKVVKKRDE